MIRISRLIRLSETLSLPVVITSLLRQAWRKVDGRAAAQPGKVGTVPCYVGKAISRHLTQHLELWAKTGHTTTGTGATQPCIHDFGTDVIARRTAVLVAKLKVDTGVFVDQFLLRGSSPERSHIQP